MNARSSPQTTTASPPASTTEDGKSLSQETNRAVKLYVDHLMLGRATDSPDAYRAALGKRVVQDGTRAKLEDLIRSGLSAEQASQSILAMPEQGIALGQPVEPTPTQRIPSLDETSSLLSEMRAVPFDRDLNRSEAQRVKSLLRSRGNE